MSTTQNRPESASDILHVRQSPLDTMFSPKNVAVVGATEKQGSVGRTVLHNLNSGLFGGNIYPINLKAKTILGVRAYPSISAVPEKVDCVVVCTPAVTVPGIITESVKCGVPSAVIISAGFKEVGPEGVKLEQQILSEARAGGMRLIGPNCLGVMIPHNGFNATFAATMAHPGNVAFVSQSGALCTAILDWSLKENVGFSAFVSIGSMLDVGWGDLIYYLGNDPRTKSIVVYMESVGDARAFLSAAREVALTKPIIAIKVGRSSEAAKAAASHTGSMTGSDEVLDAAFRRVGVLRVNSIAEVFDMAEVLSKQPRPKGPRLAIVTNAGGPGALATDMLMASGGQLADVSPEIIESLNTLLPAHWSHGNPVDVLGDANAEKYARAIEIVARDPKNDGLLVILTPQAMTEAAPTAEAMKPLAKLEGKPILASWMGGPEVERGNRILNSANIPTFEYPDTAARAFCYMWRYSYNLRSLYETPALVGEEGEISSANREKVTRMIADIRKSGRFLLSEYEAAQVMALYGIPTVQMCLAATEEEAVAGATKIGFPVVLKLYSHTITHKTDVGGVKLNITSAEGVRAAFNSIKQSVTEKAGAQHFQGVNIEPMISHSEGYEIILGSSIDPQFGPVLLFGSGGQLVEVYKDRALGLPPLNATLARRMMEQTRIYTALKGVRGRKSVDMAALEQLLVRFSHLAVEQPWIKEIDINPLLASATRLVALDARIILHDDTLTEDQLPKPAIRPYPIQYTGSWTLEDKTEVLIRPIRPEDEPLMVQFHQTLSERSVYYRYFSPLKLSQRVEHERLMRMCFNDFDREIALVAELRTPSSKRAVIGVGRLSKVFGTNDAEFSIIISDQYQNKGLGTELLKRLVQIGRDEKLSKIKGGIIPENHEMQRICERVGFKIIRSTGESECRAELNL